MTADEVIDMCCRICGESVWVEVEGHSHAWDAVAQVLQAYHPDLFAAIQRGLNDRGSR